MSRTDDTGVPLVSSQQDQPEVTHNEAITLLAAMMNGVISQTNTPPGSPTAGDAYLTGTGPTGAWASRPNRLAVYTSGGWRFFPDRDAAGSIITMGARQKGMTLWVRDDGASPPGGSLHMWDGTAWVSVTATRVED